MKIDQNNRQVKEKTDPIWERSLTLGPKSPFPRLPTELDAASQSSVLQELTSEALLLAQPQKTPTPLSPQTPISQDTPVLIVKEHFDWYLIAVMKDPWQMGWVEKNAVRVKTDFIPIVNDEHYLQTEDGRHFPRIAPLSSGYGALMKTLDPSARPPKYNIKYIIMHYTTGTRMESTINHFKSSGSGVSTHLLIGRDGRVVQFVPFNRIAHHAGYSWWEAEEGINQFSIGIELDNAGRLKRGKDGTGREGWMGQKMIIPNDRLRMDAHWKRPANQFAWETFSDVQLEVAKKIVKALKEKYDIQEILGHDDVNVLNREDPGPLFPMKVWREELFGRKEPEIKPFYLTRETNLLIKFDVKSPNESTSLHVGGPLPAGSEVVILDNNLAGFWSKISVKSSTAKALKDKTGWVQTNSLEAISGKAKKTNAGQPQKFTIKNNQPFYQLNGGEPTPRIRLEEGTRVRRQKVDSKWTLVIVMDKIIQGETGFQGWVKTDLLSEKMAV